LQAACHEQCLERVAAELLVHPPEATDQGG
jgi:hypothetical protein